MDCNNVFGWVFHSHCYLLTYLLTNKRQETRETKGKKINKGTRAKGGCSKSGRNRQVGMEEMDEMEKNHRGH